MFCLIGAAKKFKSTKCVVAAIKNCRTLKNFVEYQYGTEERKHLDDALVTAVNTQLDIPIIIGNEYIYTGDLQRMRMPHNHHQIIAKFSYASRKQIEIAIKLSLRAQETWRAVAAKDRVQIWRKCAEIIANEERHELNAAIMLSQGKTFLQAEEDTYRLIETLKTNADFLLQLDKLNLIKGDGSGSISAFSQMRPLDGFVSVVGPGNMTWLSANLAFCPALMGNCVIWKPSNNCVLTSFIIFKAMKKAGLPIGVINFLPSNTRLFMESTSQSPYLAGMNFAGRIQTFRKIWHKVSKNIYKYKCIPRLVGECGGKNFHLVHESADIDAALQATVEAAFEYTGQKSNSCSRLYIPKSIWADFSCALHNEVSNLKISDPCDYNAFTSAVLNKIYFDRIVNYISYAQNSKSVEVFCGGDYCSELGYFIAPTVLVCSDPLDRLMTEEIFGPVLCVYIYENNELDKVLELVGTSIYAYTGSIFSTDENFTSKAIKKLRMSAGNLYINEKCTGTLEGQMPFPGNKLSSSGDMSGTPYFLLRWCFPQLIEERVACAT